MFPVPLQVFCGGFEAVLGVAAVLLIFRHVRHALCSKFPQQTTGSWLFSRWIGCPNWFFPAGAQGLGGLLLAGADRLLRISAAMHGRRTEL